MLRRWLALVLLLGLLPLGGGTAVAQVGGDVPDYVPGEYLLNSYRPSPGDNALLQWNEETLECIRATRPGPTVVARALAIVHTATYEAWAAYDRFALGTLTGAELRRPRVEHTPANKSQTVSQAGYLALRDLFPACEQAGLDRLTDQGYLHPERDPSIPAQVALKATGAILEFRHRDGSNQLNGYADTTGYQPVNTPEQIWDPWRWQPLGAPHGLPARQVAATPHWRNVVPFALRSTTQFTPPPPSQDPALTTRDILAMSAALDDVGKVTAEYWADGPGSELPPGHWNVFAQHVARKLNYSIDESVKLFFALDNAMLDASIAAWEAKYRYDFARPITAIRGTLAGQWVYAWGGPYQGTQLIRAEDWFPYQRPTVVTPPFPEYVSGHSTFSAAGAAVLRSFTGSDAFGASVTIQAGASVIEPRTAVHPGTPASAVTLSWPTFTAAADEAGLSRRYGGIHFIDGDHEGRRMGAAIGDQALGLAKGYWGGRQGPWNCPDCPVHPGPPGPV